LLHELVDRGAHVGNQRVAFVAQAVVGPGGVESFVNEVLLDRERRLPVLLFTNIKEQDGVYPDDAGDPSLAARELCGQAHVYVLPRTEDTHRLTRRLGMLSAYDGAVRIYWPRFHLTDPPPRHPLHLRQRLNRSSGPAIIRRIIEAGARSYRPPDGTGALLALRWRDRERRRVDELLAGQTDPGAQVAALRGELFRAIDENVRLEDELDALRDQLQHSLQRAEDLELRLNALRERLREGETSVDLQGRPSSVTAPPAAEHAPLGGA
jgi:regulator of replication initiation timing